MKLRMSIIIVCMLLTFLTGCGGDDPNARSVKIEISEIKEWPAGDKVCAVLYKESSKTNRMRKDINVPGNVEFKVKCKGTEIIWIEFTDTKSIASINMENFGDNMTLYLDGAKINYSPVRDRGSFGLSFEIKEKSK